MTETDNYFLYFVEEFSKKTIPFILLKYSPLCDISMDKFYFCPLAPLITENKSTIVGTTSLNWKGIPKTFQVIENFEKKSTQFIYGQDKGDENTMFVFYCEKKASGMKTFSVLTTIHL